MKKYLVFLLCSLACTLSWQKFCSSFDCLCCLFASVELFILTVKLAPCASFKCLFCPTLTIQPWLFCCPEEMKTTDIKIYSKHRVLLLLLWFLDDLFFKLVVVSRYWYTVDFIHWRNSYVVHQVFHQDLY